MAKYFGYRSEIYLGIIIIVFIVINNVVTQYLLLEKHTIKKICSDVKLIMNEVI